MESMVEVNIVALVEQFKTVNKQLDWVAKQGLKVKCDECNGTGKVSSLGRFNPRTTTPPYIESDCDVCDRGYIFLAVTDWFPFDRDDEIEDQLNALNERFHWDPSEQSFVEK